MIRWKSKIPIYSFLHPTLTINIEELVFLNTGSSICWWETNYVLCVVSIEYGVVVCLDYLLCINCDWCECWRISWMIVCCVAFGAIRCRYTCLTRHSIEDEPGMISWCLKWCAEVKRTCVDCVGDIR